MNPTCDSLHLSSGSGISRKGTSGHALAVAGCLLAGTGFVDSIPTCRIPAPHPSQRPGPGWGPGGRMALPAGCLCQTVGH